MSSIAERPAAGGAWHAGGHPLLAARWGLSVLLAALPFALLHQPTLRHTPPVRPPATLQLVTLPAGSAGQPAGVPEAVRGTGVAVPPDVAAPAEEAASAAVVQPATASAAVPEPAVPEASPKPLAAPAHSAPKADAAPGAVIMTAEPAKGEASRAPSRQMEAWQRLSAELVASAPQGQAAQHRDWPDVAAPAAVPAAVPSIADPAAEESVPAPASGAAPRQTPRDVSSAAPPAAPESAPPVPEPVAGDEQAADVAADVPLAAEQVETSEQVTQGPEPASVQATNTAVPASASEQTAAVAGRPDAATTETGSTGQAVPRPDALASIGAEMAVPSAAPPQAAQTADGNGGAGDGTPPLVGTEALDAGFVLMDDPSPLYPRRALRLRRPGMARLELEVGPDGAVLGIAVLEESGDWGFGAAAVDAFREVRFTPPTVAGQPVRVRWLRTLLFRP